MALHFTLAVECGADADAARRLADYFLGKQIVSATGNHKCYPHIENFLDDNYWVIVGLDGLSESGTNTIEEAVTMTEVGSHLYALLRDAPDFRYALVGIEVEFFRLFAELTQDDLKGLFPGLVISEKIALKFGCSEFFEQFKPGYLWMPYQGETFRGERHLPKI